MTPLRAILVEDEPSGMENLRWKLEQNCPAIEIIAECTSGAEAITEIKKRLPDVIFLDIMLGDMTGFDVLKEIQYPTFETIFTTSYDQFAIDAIKNKALDYLLKPVMVDELVDAVSKAMHAHREKRGSSQTSQPVSNQVKLGFPVSTGKQFIDIKEIVYAQSDDNISMIYLAGQKKPLQITKSLSWVEGKLENYGFCRIHNSYLINLDQMKEYIRHDGGYVIMNNDKAISVSRRRKDEFLAKMEDWDVG